MIPNCAATRHVHFVLDGSGPARLDPPSLERLAEGALGAGTSKRAGSTCDRVTREEIATWKPGETLLLNGKILTGRDAAHKRIVDLLARGEGLPAAWTSPTASSTTSGPVDPVRDEVVGPAGPTTATRMDKFTDLMLEKTGLLGMIGKAERGPAGDRSDPQAPGGVPDGGGRRGLPGVEGHQVARAWWPSPISAWKRSTNST